MVQFGDLDKLNSSTHAEADNTDNLKLCIEGKLIFKIGRRGARIWALPSF